MNVPKNQSNTTSLLFLGEPPGVGSYLYGARTVFGHEHPELALQMTDNRLDQVQVSFLQSLRRSHVAHAFIVRRMCDIH